MPNKPALQIPLSPAMLKQVALFKPLQDEAEISRVCEMFHGRSFRTGETIFQHGDPGGCMYLIRTGKVRIYLPSTDGREITLRVYGAGEVFGELSLLDGGLRTASADALEAAHTYMLFRDDFLNLLRDHFGLVQHVLGLLVERLRYTTHYTQQLAFMNVPSRIAVVLLQLASESDQTDIKITQQDLANFVGTTREWVNRALKEFAKHGWVTLHRGGMTILNRNALKQSVM